MLIDKACIQLSLLKGTAGRQIVKEVEIGDGAADAVLRERRTESLQRAITGFVPNN